MTCEDYHISSGRWPIIAKTDSFSGFIHHDQLSHSIDSLDAECDEAWKG